MVRGAWRDRGETIAVAETIRGVLVVHARRGARRSTGWRHGSFIAGFAEGEVRRLGPLGEIPVVGRVQRYHARPRRRWLLRARDPDAAPRALVEPLDSAVVGATGDVPALVALLRDGLRERFDEEPAPRRQTLRVAVDFADGATAEEDLDDTDGDLRDASGALRVDAVLERLRMNGVCGATGATLLHVLARGDPEPLEPEDEASPRRSYDKMDLGELKAEVSERNAGPPKRPKRGTQSTPGQLLLVVPDGRVARSSRKPWKSSGGPQEGRRGAQTPQVRGLGVAPSRVVVCRHPAAFSSYVRCMEDNT